MNNLIYIDNMALLQYDQNIVRTGRFREYFSVITQIKFPPGLEFVVSRAGPLGIESPWGSEPSCYPIPQMPDSEISFEEAADSFGHGISQEMDQGKQVYLLWSGGIDSTIVAVSLLRNLRADQLDQLHVVMTDVSQAENPIFYDKFLKNLNRINLKDFDTSQIDLDTALILNGEGGDQIFGSSLANKTFGLSPEKISSPWINEVPFLIKNWGHGGAQFGLDQFDSNAFWEFFIALAKRSIAQSNVEVTTLFDFYWWFNFNFKMDSVLSRSNIRLSENLSSREQFMKLIQSRRYLFVSDKIQQWSMTHGHREKFNTDPLMVKFAGRQYIYDFDQNPYYYREKRKGLSWPYVASPSAKYFAYDRDYNRYSITDRSVRQHLRQLFYSGHDGRIEFYNIHAPGRIFPEWMAIIDK